MFSGAGFGPWPHPAPGGRQGQSRGGGEAHGMVLPPALRRLVGPLAVVLLVGLGFGFRHEVGPVLHALEARVLQAGPFASLLFALVLAVWGALCLPGPLILAAAGALFPSRPLVALATVMLGDTLAQAGAFLIARHLARERVQARLGGLSWFRWLEDQTRQRGTAAVFTIRLMAFFPNSMASYAFGLTSVPFWPYLAASFAGSLLPTALYVFGAAGIVHLVRSPAVEHDLWLALAIVLAVVAVNRRLSRRGGAPSAG